MYAYRLAKLTDFDSLKRLWKICFDADKEFLALYFSKGIMLTRTYVVTYENEIASALSVFDINLNGEKGGYVYGVCTHPKFRGNSLAVKLLKFTENEESVLEHNFLITRPATYDLFNYYQKVGYTIPIYRSETELKPEEGELFITPKKIDGLELFRLRNLNLGNNYFCWGINECEYITEYIQYCRGDCISLGEKKYIIGHKEENKYITLESNINKDTLKKFVRFRYQECDSIILYSRPTKNNCNRFALFKPIGNTTKPNPLTVFSFTME